MSLDTLFTDAAEAGGPPRFTEDDIGRRVSTRRRRRRSALTVAAVAVVLAGGAAGLALARQGGDEETVAAHPAPEEVPITAEALIGRWVEAGSTEPDGPATWLEFAPDGQARAEGCGHGTGPWAASNGELRLRLSRSTRELCSPHDIAYRGPATLFDDGTLRFEYAPGEPSIRPDDPRMVELRRVDAIGTTPERDQLVGTWSAGPSVQIEFTGGFIGLVDGCTSGRWSLEGDALSVDPVETDCLPAASPAVVEEVRAWLPFLESARIDDDRLLLSSPDVSIWLTRVDPAATLDLAGTRWVTTREELGDRATADWIEFDAGGRFRMSVVCGTHRGTYTIAGSTATLTVTDRNLGPACDPIAPPADAASAIVEGDHLRIDFVATAERNVPEDLTTTYTNVDSLEVPTAEDLAGAWSVATFLADSSFGTFQIVFDAEGTARVGPCRSPLGWTSTGEGIEVTPAPGDDCLADFGFREGTSNLGLRLDGERLYVEPESQEYVTVFARAAEPEPRPALVLHALRDGVGIENWTDLAVDDPEQEAAAEIGHDSGHTITVRLAALTVADPVDLSGAEVVLDGRTALVDGVLTFDCGGDRFTVSGPERRAVLDVGRWLLDTLRCDPEPPA